MQVQIEELMVKNVVCAQPHHTAEHVRSLIEKHGFHVVPVIGPEGEALGIVSSSDLLRADVKSGAPVSSFMTDKVYVTSQYDAPHVAARIMRNHKIHHVVVTDDKKVVGIVSSFDLLKLVEGHRYIAKNAPTPSKKKQQRE